jgi:hypothetical protein
MQNIQHTPRSSALFKLLLPIPFLLALLVSSIGIYYSIKAEPISTTKANSTATIQLKTIATAYVRQANTKASATTTAQAKLATAAWATTTASAQASEKAATAAALANPYHIPAQTVGLDETLLNNTSSIWESGTSTNNTIDGEFKKGGYDLISRQSMGFTIAESTHFTNFIYQVQIKMINGDEGGLVFRENLQQKTYYYFNLNASTASYSWGISNSAGFTQQSTNTSSAIKTGYNQTNLLTVVARINSFNFYINQQQVYSTNDPTYTNGQIGLDVIDDNNTTEAVFNNAKVWTF